MVIVEGPDGAGKTTLIEKLHRDLGFPVAGRVVAKDTKAMVNIAEWVEQNVKAGFQATIFDRHRLISEPVYGPILRKIQDNKFLDGPWLQEQMFRFYNSEPILIYCLPKIHVIRDNLRNDPDNVAVVNHIEAIYAAYNSRMAIDLRLNKHTFKYDYTTDDPNVIISLVKGLFHD